MLTQRHAWRCADRLNELSRKRASTTVKRCAVVRPCVHKVLGQSAYRVSLTTRGYHHLRATRRRDVTTRAHRCRVNIVRFVAHASADRCAESNKSTRRRARMIAAARQRRLVPRRCVADRFVELVAAEGVAEVRAAHAGIIDDLARRAFLEDSAVIDDEGAIAHPQRLGDVVVGD